MAPTPIAFALAIIDGPTPKEVNEAKQPESSASATTSSPSATATALQTASATASPSASPIGQRQACGSSCGVAIALTLIGLIILGFLAYMIFRTQKKLSAAKAAAVPEIRVSDTDSDTESVSTVQTDLKDSMKEIEKTGKKVWRWGGGKK